MPRGVWYTDIVLIFFHILELVKLLPVHRYSVDIFSYSGPSGILGSYGKQNTTFKKPVLGGVRIVALSILFS